MSSQSLYLGQESSFSDALLKDTIDYGLDEFDLGIDGFDDFGETLVDDVVSKGNTSYDAGDLFDGPLFDDVIPQLSTTDDVNSMFGDSEAPGEAPEEINSHDLYVWLHSGLAIENTTIRRDESALVCENPVISNLSLQRAQHRREDKSALVWGGPVIHDVSLQQSPNRRFDEEITRIGHSVGIPAANPTHTQDEYATSPSDVLEFESSPFDSIFYKISPSPCSSGSDHLSWLPDVPPVGSAVSDQLHTVEGGDTVNETISSLIGAESGPSVPPQFCAPSVFLESVFTSSSAVASLSSGTRKRAAVDKKGETAALPVAKKTKRSYNKRTGLSEEDKKKRKRAQNSKAAVTYRKKGKEAEKQLDNDLDEGEQRLKMLTGKLEEALRCARVYEENIHILSASR